MAISGFRNISKSGRRQFCFLKRSGLVSGINFIETRPLTSYFNLTRASANVSETLTADDAWQMMAQSASLNHLPIRVSATPGPPVASRCLAARPASGGNT
jgi:hypothetical protein